MTHMMLQAQELGLGTTWVMALNPDIAKKVLNIPENLDVISFMPTGYPADDAQINPLHYKHKGSVKRVSCAFFIIKCFNYIFIC